MKTQQVVIKGLTLLGLPHISLEVWIRVRIKSANLCVNEEMWRTVASLGVRSDKQRAAIDGYLLFPVGRGVDQDI